MLDKKINHGRIKPKKESTFGKVKKPFKGKKRNRKGNTKSSFLDLPVKRLKPKYSSKNVKVVDVEGLKYLHILKGMDLPCFACGAYGSIELHHIKECSSDKKVHTEVLPLCGDKCHRLGTELSAHGTPKKFREVFPIELQREFAKELYKKVMENYDG